MAAIVKELEFAASPEKVYRALTEPEEIARWWTDDLNIQPEVGELAEFRFAEGTFAIQVRIAELIPNEEVYWISKQGLGPKESIISFQLAPIENGVRLVFIHDGYHQFDASYEQDRAMWNSFFRSLETYLETGKGAPVFPRS